MKRTWKIVWGALLVLFILSGTVFSQEQKEVKKSGVVVQKYSFQQKHLTVDPIFALLSFLKL